jgi:hypothetical protein
MLYNDDAAISNQFQNKFLVLRGLRVVLRFCILVTPVSIGTPDTWWCVAVVWLRL